MKIDTDSLVPIILIWGLPAFMVVRGYLKMNKVDKKSAINDFKSLRFICTGGFLVMGAFFSHLGFLFALSTIGLIGIVFFTLGGIISTFYMWNKSRIKSVLMILLIALFLWYLLN